MLGRFIASGNELRDWASGSPINTDDNALLEFSAPRNMYRGQELVLAQALNDLRRSPFDEWMAYDESVAEQQRIVQLTNDAVRSRLVRTDGTHALDGGRYARMRGATDEGVFPRSRKL